LPRLLPLLITPPQPPQSFQLLLSTLLPQSWLLVLNRLDGHKYGSGSNIKQHQWQLCQVLAKCNQIQTCLGPSILLIGAKSKFISSQVLIRTSPYLQFKLT
jgi:hypothetical protein